MSRASSIRNAVGVLAGGAAGLALNKWITCRGGG